jgi:DNA repair protein RecN (Recombination protein N)
MIKSIRVQNYALIDRAEIDVPPGFSVITGETGAGKSILLGAIGLTVGNRADASMIADKERKCVAEITHDVSGYPLAAWFEEHDLDHGGEVVVRREIHADGRSRAFVNDTPVSGKTLKELGEYLVDIHSQHQSLLIGQPGYQLELLDRFGGHLSLLEEYRAAHGRYLRLTRERDDCRQRAVEAAREEEYIRFQLDRIEAARPRPGEQRELEEEIALLSRAGEIKGTLAALAEALDGTAEPLTGTLRLLRARLAAIEEVLPGAREHGERLQSVIIELQDIADEAGRRAETVEDSPARTRAARERLDELYDLLHKYKVADVDGLLREKEALAARLRDVEELDHRLEELSGLVRQLEEDLATLADRLHQARARAAVPLEEETRALLVELGIKHARFSVVVEPRPVFTATGRDAVTFLFSANKNHEPGELSRVASGGEVSRLMLAMKYILSRAKQLPAIIFDEIDAGVSGEIAHRVASLLKRVSSRVQVISITHLPQVAAAGNAHFKVYKEEGSRQATLTRVKRLTPAERVVEIAAMTSGTTISDAAIENARQLLQDHEG